MTDTNTPAFSLGQCGPQGKYTQEVKTHLDESAHMDLLRLCADLDVKPSEFIRDLLYRVLYQRTPAEMVAHRRAPVLDRLGPNAGRGERGHG